MALATYDDVAVAIGRPISDSNEQQQVEQWLSDVEMLISARLGDVSGLDANVLTYVEREAVVARMRHRAETGADGTDTGEENYFLRVLTPWWALLETEDVGQGGAFTIRPAHTPDCGVRGWSGAW